MPQPIRILNVDDNQVQRYTTSRWLKASGFEVPQTRTFKSQATTAGIPIIEVCAVFSTYSQVRDGLRNGADAYFTFPLDAKSLISTVQELAKGQPPA